MKKLNFNWSWGRKKDPPPESNKELSKPKAAAISPGRVSVDEDNSAAHQTSLHNQSHSPPSFARIYLAPWSPAPHLRRKPYRPSP